jgi:phospholipid/cholesterol/gamma-HCH transport system permease protein
VLALQSGITLDQFGARPFVGRLVSASMLKELGPVLTGLMLAGRVGSGIAAELGSMVVTIRSTRCARFGTDPVRKLVVPACHGRVIMAPILTIIADTVGILGGWMVAVFQLRVAPSVYWTSVIDGLYPNDAWMGIIKPFCLGLRHCVDRLSRRTTHARRYARRRPCHDERRRRGIVAVVAVDLVVTQLIDYAVVLDGCVDCPESRVARLDDKVVLKDVSFELLPGHTKVILGGSGSGSPRS